LPGCCHVWEPNRRHKEKVAGPIPMSNGELSKND
jgi:hypothetical protein